MAMTASATALAREGIHRSNREALISWLRRIGGRDDAEIDLSAAALALAGLALPGTELGRYEHHLSLLARDTAELAGKAGAHADVDARATILREVIAGRYGYEGDAETYDDLENANLMRVIDRRMGLPIALAILYIHAGRAQGWQADGLNFPGHFLVRLQLGGERRILDPFHGGVVRQTEDLRALLKAMAGNAAELKPEYFEAADNRGILIRLQNNLKQRMLRERQPADAIEVVETMLMFAPSRAELWREAGLIHAHLENVRAASLALEHYLELAGTHEAQRRQEALNLLNELRRRLN
jgi:regulator of sirC expression with transglutaminase-like and TPR domain